MVNYDDPDFSAKEFGSLNDGLWNQGEVFKFIAYLLFNKEALKLKLQRRYPIPYIEQVKSSSKCLSL